MTISNGFTCLDEEQMLTIDGGADAIPVGGVLASIMGLVIGLNIKK